MNDFELTEKLYHKSGPVLRYRIATELMDKIPDDIEYIEKCAIIQKEVQENIKFYSFGADQGVKGKYIYSKMIHGCRWEVLENVAGKLWSFGIRKGTAEIDKYLDTYIKIMEYDYYRKGIMRVGYGKNDIAILLSLLGYANEQPVSRIMQIRLDQLYSFVQKEQFDIYVSAKGYPKLPSQWKDVDQIIDPNIAQYSDEDGQPPLPFIYDIYGFIGMKQAGISEGNERKIISILKYCCDERYQKDVRPGYGILLAPTGRYYSCGWSVHLSGIGQELSEDIDINQLLLRVEMLSYFSIVKDIPLVYELLDFLERYRVEDGFYCFPKKFIPENKTGYFVMGLRMGLGENRRKKDGYITESTFRVLKIKKNLGLFR